VKPLYKVMVRLSSLVDSERRVLEGLLLRCLDKKLSITGFSPIILWITFGL